MPRRIPGIAWSLMGLLVAAGGIASWLSHARTETRLRAEIASARDGLAGSARAIEQAQSSEPVNVTPMELEALRNDHVVLGRMRLEVEQLKQAAQSRPVPATTSPSMSPAGSWRNAGRSDARRALETVLWSANTGEMEILASALEIAGPAREKLELLWTSLEPAMQANYRSPEGLVASLLSHEASFTGLRVEREAVNATGYKIMALTGRAGGRVTRTELSFMEQESGWKLVVPPAAVDRYAAMIGGTGGSAVK